MSFVGIHKAAHKLLTIKVFYKTLRRFVILHPSQTLECYKVIRSLDIALCRPLENNIQTLYKYSFLGKPYNICDEHTSQIIQCKKFVKCWVNTFCWHVENHLQTLYEHSFLRIISNICDKITLPDY
jgi:hypothetical protein